MIAELYIQHEMPEPPKESFFKGLFGGGMRNLDREELCEYFSSMEFSKFFVF
jgi:syntaxin-binding protein 5